MKPYLSFILLLIFVSCGESESSNNKNNNESQVISSDSLSSATPQNDSLPFVENTASIYTNLLENPLFFFPEEIDQLRKYFNDTLIVKLDSCQFELRETTTDQGLLHIYKNALALNKQLLDAVFALNLPDEVKDGWYPDYVIRDFEEIEKATMGLKTSCVAECTELDFTFFLPDFKQQAAVTKGNLDNEFFELLMIADGEYGGDGYGWKEWFERTWDYGGGSLLGDSIHTKFLIKMNDFQQKNSDFSDLFKIYREIVLTDIQHGIYMRTKTAVMTEMEQILALDFLTPDEKAPINELLEKFKNDDLKCDCPGGSYQFHCEDFEKNCNWGG